MTAISERQRARLYIYKKKNRETFLNTKRTTTSVTFLFSKSKTLYDTQFSWKFLSWYLYTKSMTLCVTWRFHIHKSRHFAKSKTICVTFLCTKMWTLCITQFLLNFWNWRRGDILYAKYNSLRVIFLYI